MSSSNYNTRTPDATYRWTLNPSDVNDDGTFELGDITQSIIGLELRPPPPNDEHLVPVISMRSMTELFEYCPSCGVVVPDARPIFSAGLYMVYPCTSCEWVWCDGSNPHTESMV